MMVATSMQTLGIADTACERVRTSSVRVAMSRCAPRRSRCSSGAAITPDPSEARSR